ncbi:hypothetical protein KEJ21_01980 [Candidatus Bathyarchaeota archaeon]|nr:hypothetical protein [Candidatus Bathyarchaeota archaeon]MBS7630530.1 hypothetical protein [Candidatus Bathyarchaeota archaeon]
MLKLMLVEDDRILLEIPLSADDWNFEELNMELNRLDDELEKISGLFDIYSNASRIKMMRAFFEASDRCKAFTELMHELDMNPKIVSEGTRKLQRVGIIKKDDKGKYKLTRMGEIQFMMTSILLRKMEDTLRKMEVMEE